MTRVSRRGLITSSGYRRYLIQ